MSEVKDVIVQGLWKNNSALVQLLGMCPLLAVTSTATNALGLGLATTLVLTLTNLTISSLRRWTPAEIRIPIYVMIIASVVSVVQMLINAYAFGLYQSLGIFIPLIVTNCIVVGRAEAFAAKKRASAVGTGRFLDRHGRYLRDVCAGLPARDPWQRHPV
ncbi:electron transport complex protein RnfE [Klebsiella pneumoniae]|nr:electron transport complex protein RnfE [Klebsiella pneumoniae]